MTYMQRVMHSAYQQAELQDVERPILSASHIAGSAVCSLLSPGTEINHAYCGDVFPRSSGYASIFRVEEIAADVDDFEIGDLAFSMAGHDSWVHYRAADAIKVPAGLDPELAVLARLMGVSHTTLVTTKARPGDRVFITGLGPVGYLAAVQFKLSGYEVYASDPNEQVCTFACEAGINIINDSKDREALGAILAIDCSGHEMAVMDCAQALRRCGELVLIGVPWKQRSELSAHAILDWVFHKYIQLRSGWEWELPREESHFAQTRSIKHNFEICLQWLAQDRIPIPPTLCKLFNPHDCNEVYAGHLTQSHQHLCSLFDWR